MKTSSRPIPLFSSNLISFSGGTFFAAPFVAGIATLMLSANPILAPAQIKATLTQTAGNMLPG
ncbi:S8 family serine peptidase [Leptolyngbya sp. FACHB-711]|uniref:S8 family serine peptidase n=1 Tax=unclassified Leptolyngbya TaxID=2650499 RepID=UPI0018EFEA6B